MRENHHVDVIRKMRSHRPQNRDRRLHDRQSASDGVDDAAGKDPQKQGDNNLMGDESEQNRHQRRHCRPKTEVVH